MIASLEVDAASVNKINVSLFNALSEKPLCRSGEVHNVTADMMVEGSFGAALEERGFSPANHSIFEAEGLMMHLGVQQLGLLAAVSRLAKSGSVSILNFLTSSEADIASVRCRSTATP